MIASSDAAHAARASAWSVLCGKPAARLCSFPSTGKSRTLEPYGSF
jgi:hypothetical protein